MNRLLLHRVVPSLTSSARIASLASCSKRCSVQAFSTLPVDDALDLSSLDVHPLYPKLFSPLELPQIGVLPNRFLMGSMHTGLEKHSMPRWMVPLLGLKNKASSNAEHASEQMAAYFVERAKGGVGLMVTGGVSPNIQGWTGPFSSKLTTQDEVRWHQGVTDAVHQVPVQVGMGPTTVAPRICLQILHTGRYAYHPFAVSASSSKSPISPFQARGLSKAGVERTKRAFVRTAVLAKEAGYDGVEIMGSEGYLLSQFLSPRTNKRTDDYGGTLANRARLPLEIVQETRQAVGPDFLIIFRLSLLDLVEDGLLFEESLELATMLERAGVSILNTGIGWHEARVPTIATSVPRASFAFPTHRLKEANVVSIPVVATNRINHPSTAEQVLEACDMISMARPFLADPDLVVKSREGREDEINTCIACNQACLDHVFVGKVASCLVNPRACHENELKLEPLPPDQRLTIGVIGSGPAGCAFAVTAAGLGHAVTLYDRDSAIGGQFNMAKRIPGKEEFHETLRYFRTMLKKHNVEIRLNTDVSADNMITESKDKWIVATGVDPRDPKIPGQDHANVLSYIDVLKRKKRVGKRVAIVGAGGIGFDVSEYLLHYFGADKAATETSADEFLKEWGIDPTLKTRGGLTDPHPHHVDRQIYLLQRKKGKLGAGLGKTTGWIHRATLNNSGAVEMISGVTYEKIDADGNLHITQSGKLRVLEVDNVVICAGQVERRVLETTTAKEEALKGKVYTIGGAYHAGELDAKRAIDMGTRLALKIHDTAVVPGKHVFSAEEGVEEQMFHLLKRFR